MFADRYIERVIKTKSHLCVGLDPDLKKYPTYILKQAEEQENLFKFIIYESSEKMKNELIRQKYEYNLPYKNCLDLIN